jgi:hypothetical protein
VYSVFWPTAAQKSTTGPRGMWIHVWSTAFSVARLDRYDLFRAQVERGARSHPHQTTGGKELANEHHTTNDTRARDKRNHHRSNLGVFFAAHSALHGKWMREDGLGW